MTSWTKNNIPDLNEKVFIVTDANSGLGYETRLALTARPDALSAIADQGRDVEEQRLGPCSLLFGFRLLNQDKICV